jgi:hypothetical protein
VFASAEAPGPIRLSRPFRTEALPDPPDRTSAEAFALPVGSPSAEASGPPGSVNRGRRIRFRSFRSRGFFRSAGPASSRLRDPVESALPESELFVGASSFRRFRGRFPFPFGTSAAPRSGSFGSAWMVFRDVVPACCLAASDTFGSASATRVALAIGLVSAASRLI